MTGPAGRIAAYNLNTIWSCSIAQQLVQAGITRVLICPGGRSAALALALEAEPGLDTQLFNDERSAAFFALGLARALDGPVAVSATSGTAVANLLPALVEAKAQSVPILILTCDRPEHERDGGGPQYADHLELCRAVADTQLDMSEPQDDAIALDAMRARLANGLAGWLADPARGPAQVNLPFRGIISALDADFAPATIAVPASALVVARPQERQALDPVAKLRALDLPKESKGLIVVGSDRTFPPEAIATLANRTGFPVLTDAASGLRRPNHIPGLISDADLICMSTSGKKAVPDLVIQIGKVPVFHGMHRFLERQTCPLVMLDRHEIRADFLQRSFVSLACGTGDDLGDLASALGECDADWAAHWQAMASETRATVAEVVAELPWGEMPAVGQICDADGFGLLHLGNSMPVRIGNLLCRPSDQTQQIYANRGVNGIDGTIGCFLGEAAALGTPGLAILGDLTFLHDFAALELAHQSGARGAICVIQNGGGAVFDFLPGQDLPGFAKAIRNQRRANVAGLAAAFDLPYHKVASSQALGRAIDAARKGDALHLIDIDVPPESARDGIRSLFLSTAFN